MFKFNFKALVTTLVVLGSLVVGWMVYDVFTAGKILTEVKGKKVLYHNTFKNSGTMRVNPATGNVHVVGCLEDASEILFTEDTLIFKVKGEQFGLKPVGESIGHELVCVDEKGQTFLFMRYVMPGEENTIANEFVVVHTADNQFNAVLSNKEGCPKLDELE